MERCEKVLTPSDVSDRLSVTKDMLEIMPPIDPKHDISIQVSDEWGKFYEFFLSCRPGRYKKPVFRAKEWRAFVNERCAKAGDVIHFSLRENAAYQTQYRMALLQVFLPSKPDL